MNSFFDPTLLLQLTCHSPDEFQEKAIGWDIDHFQSASGDYKVSLDMVHTRNIQMSDVIHHIGVHERGGILPGVYAVSLPVVLGTDPLYFCGGRLDDNECPGLLSGEEFETHSRGSVEYFSLVVDADLLDREAVQLIGCPFSDLAVSQRVCIKKRDQLQLVQTITALMQKLKNSQHRLPVRQEELIEKQLIEQLLLSIRPPSGRMKIPNRRLVAWRAEKLIRQHPEQHLDINQLCCVIGCSARTLHLGFKERYGTTPGQYSRTLALNAVHQKLCHRTQEKNISEIAMAWGFYHLGRFSQQYKQLFAELPSVTLKRYRTLNPDQLSSQESHPVFEE